MLLLQAFFGVTHDFACNLYVKKEVPNQKTCKIHTILIGNPNVSDQFKEKSIISWPFHFVGSGLKGLESFESESESGLGLGLNIFEK